MSSTELLTTNQKQIFRIFKIKYNLKIWPMPRAILYISSCTEAYIIFIESNWHSIYYFLYRFERYKSLYFQCGRLLHVTNLKQKYGNTKIWNI